MMGRETCLHFRTLKQMRISTFARAVQDVARLFVLKGSPSRNMFSCQKLSGHNRSFARQPCLLAGIVHDVATREVRGAPQSPRADLSICY